MADSSSGTTTASGSGSQPAARSASIRAGPAVSSRSPAAERFEQVTTTASCVAADGTPGSPSADQDPLRPPSFSSRATRSITMSRCSALAMSYSVSAATLAAVSASISTPVRAVTLTSARMATVPACAVRGQRHLHLVQRQRMAERDQVGRPLGGADAGQPRHAEGIALRPAGVHQRRQRVRLHPDRGFRHGAACGHGLVAHVDHARLAARTKMARRHPMAPSRSASYVRPASAAGSPSGTTSRALAVAIGRSCDEACPPAGRASSPSAPRASRTRR